jgi:uncharacterized damage-inducible protein DinB
VKPRSFPAFVAGEREMLEAWLDWHRETLARKCEGLKVEQLRERATSPSPISLLGLVRHMAEVERGWFRRRIAAQDIPYLYIHKADEDADFNDVDGADADADFVTWRAECEAAREVMRGVESLERTFDWHGNTVSVRWLLVHMIEEYARHAGHADLIRERLDGSTGL